MFPILSGMEVSWLPSNFNSFIFTNWLKLSGSVISWFLSNPKKFNVPLWLLNRRKDPETNEDKHIITDDMRFIQENDVKILKKIKSYKGVRHMHGLPTRGQRTKSNFRRNKGNVIGVKRKKGKSGRT